MRRNWKTLTGNLMLWVPLAGFVVFLIATDPVVSLTILGIGGVMVGWALVAAYLIGAGNRDLPQQVLTDVVRIQGKQSGDYEAWCFDVGREVWSEVQAGEWDANDLEDAASPFNTGMYRLYPQDILRFAAGRPIQFVEPA